MKTAPPSPCSRLFTTPFLGTFLGIGMLLCSRFANAETQFQIAPLEGWLDVSPNVEESANLEELTPRLHPVITSLRTKPEINSLYVHPKLETLFRVSFFPWDRSVDEEKLADFFKTFFALANTEMKKEKTKDSSKVSFQKNGFLQAKGHKIPWATFYSPGKEDQVFSIYYMIFGKGQAADIRCMGFVAAYKQSKKRCDQMVQAIKVLE